MRKSSIPCIKEINLNKLDNVSMTRSTLTTLVNKSWKIITGLTIQLQQQGYGT